MKTSSGKAPDVSISIILAMVGLTSSATPLTGSSSCFRLASRTEVESCQLWVGVSVRYYNVRYNVRYDMPGMKRRSCAAVRGSVRRARVSSSLQKEETQVAV